ncbi:hypothetical protein P0082_05175 [Candidatus Haliotispira prima]|uniref:Uncharacterized protein n=1 Tax=Candidatus Haliotispira prima TaxID=3034016 RepID=A0ABY8MJV2_9SPIO|nr:hypothetical protein P0082_05175 [Candidatus Haliotispira prima]
MKKKFVLLPFGLLGGLATFLGGLVGGVAISVLLVRSLLAVVICIASLSALFYLLSKTVFPDADPFQDTDPPQEPPRPDRETPEEDQTASLRPKRQSSILPRSKSRAKKRSEEDLLIAASDRHRDSSMLSADSLAHKIEQEARAQNQQNSNTIEGQLRSTDTGELANLVRHSINEEL